MIALGLSAEYLERRKQYMMASDAKPAVEGDWPAIGRDKLGVTQPEDLSDNLAVQGGSYNEPFNLYWYEKMTGRDVTYHSNNLLTMQIWAGLTGKSAVEEFIVSAEYPWMACSLDAMSTTPEGYPCVLDAKSAGRFSHDEFVLRYTAAGTHQAVVCNVDYWALSVLIGGNKFDVVYQAVDPFFREQLIARERECWSYISRGEVPPDMREPAPLPKPQPKRRSMAFDTTTFGTPEWGEICSQINWAPEMGNEALTFAETDGAAKAHFAASTAMKKLLPEDVGVLDITTRRGLVQMKQDGRGISVVFKEKANG